MKSFILLLFISFSTGITNAQSADVQQLILDVQKLTQLKSILTDMQQGYTIISRGYTAVSDIVKGNFNLHEIFLDGLLAVSPTVKNYSKVAEIISYQTAILKEYQSAYHSFQSSGIFTTDEINYIGKVYSRLFNESIKNLDALLMVITASNLRMNDAERLQSIDKIHGSMLDQLVFLRQFNTHTQLLSQARAKDINDYQTMSRIYGITP